MNPSLSATPANRSAETDSVATSTADIAILIVSYNGRRYLDDCLRSVFASDDGPLRKFVVLVDNASQDDSAAFVREHFAAVEVIESPTNLGFAQANNVAWQFAVQRCPNLEFVFLLNQDTIVESGWLRPLVEHLRNNADVGCVQSKLLLHPEVATINTAGNRSHYLGFGFPEGLRQEDNSYTAVRSIAYASGAAALVRANLLQTLGLFEPEMFMYLEDADLGWKIRQYGYDVRFVPESRVYHKYRFNKEYRYYFHLERNRWWLLLVYYRLATLVLLFPALLLMEFGQCVFALSQGRIVDKLRACAYFLRPRSIKRIFALRRQAQLRRKISDKEFLARFDGSINTPQLSGFLVRRIANPIFAGYWAVVRQLIFW